MKKKEMKVTIVYGPHWEENVQKVYHYVVGMIRKELQVALEAGMTKEEFWNDYFKGSSCSLSDNKWKEYYYRSN